MTLAADVTARLSTDYLRQLTNPDSPGAASVNTTRLALAVTDSEAQFSTVAGITYDSTDATHTAIGWQLVVNKLRQYARAFDGATIAFGQELEKQLARLARRSAKAWIAPVTDGKATPTAETAQEPDVDIDLWGNMIGRPPISEANETDTNN